VRAQPPSPAPVGRPDARPLAAAAALVAGAAGIAFAPIFVRWSEVGPTATGFWRILLALPVLWVARGLERRRGTLRSSPPVSAGLLVLAGLCFAGDLAVWHAAIWLTTVANATLLANLSPLVVTLVAWAFLGERFRPGFLAALAVALAGVVLVVGSSALLSVGRSAGDLLGVTTAAFYAGYILSVERLRVGWPPATLLLWSGLVSCAALLPLAVALGEPLVATSARGWLVLVGLGVVSHACGQGLIAWALAHVRAALVAVTLLLQPVLAAGLAWLFFGEGMGPWQGLGALLVLGGIAWARSRS
jgi:drug/metabolite transporter (DMT)-like permease